MKLWNSEVRPTPSVHVLLLVIFGPCSPACHFWSMLSLHQSSPIDQGVNSCLKKSIVSVCVCVRARARVRVISRVGACLSRFDLQAYEAAGFNFGRMVSALIG